MSANATEKQLAAITEFGQALGLAFQVIDDILDVTQTSEKLGKSAGKDAAAQKATYPAVIGLDKSRAEAHRLTKKAHAALASFGPRRSNCTRSPIICSSAITDSLAEPALSKVEWLPACSFRQPAEQWFADGAGS